MRIISSFTGWRGPAFALLLIVFAAGITGCSVFLQPSEKEVLKAIESSGILSSDAFTVTSPVTIVDRGKRNEDGSWPVKVRMNIIMKMANGQMSEPRENTVTFRIFKSPDNGSNSVWKASL